MLCVDLNARSSQDEATPLHLACRYNSGSVTQFVLAKLLAINAKDAINYKDAKGRTPLHYATRRGHDMVIKVSVYIDRNQLLNVAKCNKVTHLF